MNTVSEEISKSRAGGAGVGGGSGGGGRVFTCVGCRSTIMDQYVLQVAPDLEWHADCLRCADCGQQLDEQNTCFVRDGKTYCKADYLRLFGIKCVGCRLGFKMTDLVMRARHRIYHLDCFRCSMCRRRLVPGDEYALDDDHDPVTLYCRHDYDAGPSSPSVLVPSSQIHDALHGAGGGRLSPSDNRGTTTNDEAPDNNNDIKATTSENSSSPPHSSSSNNNNNNNATANSSSSSSSAGGSLIGGMIARSSLAVGKKNGGIPGAGGSRAGGSGGGRTHHKNSSDHPKTTRVRTVLNEKQLHTLRTCYAANPRPDALMKDQLVEMTGLSSRVIRVWFQNKRCKDKKRTILIKQIQQQHQDKLQGVPLIATSPVHHDPTASLQATPVEIHQFIHHHHPISTSSWNSIAASASAAVAPGGDGAGATDYTAQPPVPISADARDPGQGQPPPSGQGQGHGMAFQQLLSSFGESDDDDTVVSLEETSNHPPQAPTGLHVLLPPVTLGGAPAASRVAMQRIARFSNDIHLHPSSSRLAIHHHQHQFICQTPHLFNSSSSNFISTPAHLIQQPTLKAFDAKC